METLIEREMERMSAAEFRGGGQSLGSPSSSRQGGGYIGSTSQNLSSQLLVLIGGRPRGRGRIHVNPSISCVGDQKDNGANSREFRMGPNERFNRKFLPLFWSEDFVQCPDLLQFLFFCQQANDPLTQKPSCTCHKTAPPSHGQIGLPRSTLQE